jgi:hypothetical protein
MTNEAPDDSFGFSGFCAIEPTLKDNDGRYIAGGNNDTNPFVDHCANDEMEGFRVVGEFPLRGGDAFTYIACEEP